MWYQIAIYLETNSQTLCRATTADPPQQRDNIRLNPHTCTSPTDLYKQWTDFFILQAVKHRKAAVAPGSFQACEIIKQDHCYTQASIFRQHHLGNIKVKKNYNHKASVFHMRRHCCARLQELSQREVSQVSVSGRKSFHVFTCQRWNIWGEENTKYKSYIRCVKGRCMFGWYQFTSIDPLHSRDTKQCTCSNKFCLFFFLLITGYKLYIEIKLSMRIPCYIVG